MKTTLLSIILLSATVGQAATVSGRVQVAGRLSRTAAVTIVYAEPLDRAAVLAGTFTMSQKNKTFSPAVLPVPAGSTVQFPNDDLIFHNVFSLNRPSPFDLGLYRAGASKARTFSTPSIYRIFCNVHPQMTAIVLVLPTSYFTQADAMGNYRLDLPAGRYRLTAWSERSDPSTTEITVAAAPLNAASLSLDESRFVETGHKNKFGLDYALIAYDPLRDKKSK